MKSLIKKFAKTNLGLIIRNTLKFKPVYLAPFIIKNPSTVSDAFLWRTDSSFKTKFKFSDILKLFYKVENSWVEIHFYTKDNDYIKKIKLTDLDISNELDITSEFMNGMSDFGTFYIYHFVDKNVIIENENIISNRCYLGYSKNNSLHSFVHGNTHAKFTTIHNGGTKSSDIVKTSLFKNQNYTIQKYFDGFDKTELFFVNPTSKLLKFSIGTQNYALQKGCSKLIEIEESIISINSNCMFLRPTIFSYKNSFFDVHHS